MKRFITVVVASTMLCAILCSCGKPRDVSDEMYDIGIAALKVADEYMAYEIDGDTAYGKMDSLYYDADIVCERTKDTEFHSGDFGIKLDISAIVVNIISANYKGVPSDIKKDRDELAKDLGK